MNENTDITLTTSQAALLLQVHESSVKRWSNAGELRLEKTSGGHRRIPFESLMEFCRARQLAADILFFAPHEEEVARAAFDAREQGDFTGVRELVLRFCDTESPRWLVNLIRYLDGVFAIPMAKVFDTGIAGALGEVGRQWQSGSRTIALEHRFTQKILDALHGILNEMENDFYANRDTKNMKEGMGGGGGDDLRVKRPHAILGCSEACHHEIGVFMARVLLLRAGWTVTYLGANVPYEEMAGIQELERAQLVCMSFALPLGAGDVRRCLKVLNALRQPQAPYEFVVGGLPFAAGTEGQYESAIPLTFAASMEGFEQWIATRFPLDVPAHREALAEVTA